MKAKDILESFELYYHDEYGESIVSGAIDSYLKHINKPTDKACKDCAFNDCKTYYDVMWCRDCRQMDRFKLSKKK